MTTPLGRLPATSMLAAPRGSGDAPGSAGAFYRERVLPNLRVGVEAVLTEEVRKEGIAEVEEDPRYENLYDRALAIMGDGAVVEHLAVAASVDGAEQVMRAGANWTVGLSAAWRQEATRDANYGNAYVTSRLLKSLTIGHDTFGTSMTDGDRGEVEEFLVALATTLWTQWFSRPDVSGRVGLEPGRHSPHHASVEWSAFGVGALGLLDVTSEASTWAQAALDHLVDELLPYALTADGAPVEGIGIRGYEVFWVSTMFSRIQFMDVLRNVTGRDLFTEHRYAMRTEMAEALFHRVPPLAEGEAEDRLPMLSRPLAPVGCGTILAWLAARLEDSNLQALAMLDARAGSLGSSFDATPGRGIRGRGPTNSYAPLWFADDLAPQEADLDPRPVTMASLAIVTAPRGWRQGGFSAAIDEGRIVVWLDDELVYQDLVPERVCDIPGSQAAGTPIYTQIPGELHGVEVGAGRSAAEDLLEARNTDGRTVARVRISADGRSARLERRVGDTHGWRTAMTLDPTAGHESWRLAGVAGATQVTGSDCRLVPGAVTDTRLSVGYGLLEMRVDADPVTCHDHRLIPPDGTDAAWAILDFTVDDNFEVGSAP